jgi:aromatic ring-cleaving dioxygenase
MTAIDSYHAHVYFDAHTRDAAWALRERLPALFPEAEIGRFHERPVGPHPRWSFQIAFGPEAFDQVIPWLMLHRGGLTVFLHPNTGDAYTDHADRAVWMGELLPLYLEALRG